MRRCAGSSGSEILARDPRFSADREAPGTYKGVITSTSSAINQLRLNYCTGSYVIKINACPADPG